MSNNQAIDDWTVPSTADTASYVQDMDVEEPKNATDEVLKLSVTPKHKSIGIKHSNKWTSACVTIQASDMPDNYEDKTSSLDVTVALDVSGSMSGQKLKDCKSTLESMLRPLGPKDRFGLVTFGSYANVVIPACFMNQENKQNALAKIKALNTQGSTNLSGGLTLAWQEMLLIDTPNQVRSVFLLTDGQANEGVRETGALAEMVQSLSCGDSVPSPALNEPSHVRASPFSIRGSLSNIRHVSFKSKKITSQKSSKIPASVDVDNKGAPISLFCFGYGSGHNSDMLRTISEVTPGGAYYFVENDSDVSTAFGDAMGGLLSVMAQSAVLKLSVPPAIATSGVKIRDVHHDQKVDRGDGSFTVSLGDFYAEESRDVVFDLDLSALPSDTPVLHVQVSLSYMNILNKKNTQAGPLDCSIARPDSVEASPADMYVESQWVRICTVRDIEAANMEAQHNQLGSAQARLRRVADNIKQSEAYNLDNSLMTALESNVWDVMISFQSSSAYVRGGGHRSTNVSHSLKNQRGMTSSAASAAPYQTSYKRKMAAGFSSKSAH